MNDYILVWNTGGPHGVHRPAVEVAKLPAPVHVASKYYIRALNNVLIGSVPIDHKHIFAIIRCTITEPPFPN